MEKGFVSNSAQWNSHSGVVLDRGGGQIPNGRAAANGRYLSPKEGHPAIPGKVNFPNRQQQTLPSSAVNGNPLLGVDLPNHMFMQDINFENQKGQGDYYNSEQMETNTRAAQNGSLNMSDNQLDLFEQQQAKEQAKLLHRFKELRQMQLQQQQLLMYQQQSQLMALKSEQNRVQDMITKQRQNQWGGKVLKAPMSEGSPFISPRKGPVDITQALAHGMVTQYQHMHDLADNRVNHNNSQAGLPRPMIPDTDSEGGCHTNPELYSNPGSVDSHFSEDLIPLPRLPSEDGDFIHQPQSHLESWPPREVIQDSPDEENDLESDYVPPAQHRIQAQTWPQRDITQAVSKPTQSEGFETDEGIGTQSFHNSPAGPQPVRQVTMETRPFPQSDDEEEGDDTLQRSCVQVYEEDIHPDDRPVSSVVVGKKTFEELLEEQLKAEEGKLQQSPSAENKPTKRPFLKRGHGLERFKAPARKKEILQTSKKPVQSKKAEPHSVATSRKTASSVKNGNTSTLKASQGNHTQQKSKAELDNNAMKRTIPTLKSDHGQSGVPQKSLKLRSTTKKTSMVINKKVELHGVSSSSDNVNNNHKLSKSEIPNSEDRRESGSTSALAESATNNTQQANQNSERRPVDSSFLSHLVKLGANQKVEEEDLEEFEMLEHFADNASFSSNSSLVVKVLQKDRLKAAQFNGNGSTGAPQGYNNMGDHMRFFKPPTFQGNTDQGSALSPPRVNVEDDSSDSDSSSSESSDSDTGNNGLLSTIKRRDLLSDNRNDKKSEANVQTNIEDSEHPGNFWKANTEGSNSDSDVAVTEKGYGVDDPTSKAVHTSEVTNSPVKRKIAGRNSSQLSINALQSEINSQRYKLHLQQSESESDSDSVSTSSDEEVDKTNHDNSQSGDRNSNNQKASLGQKVNPRNNEQDVVEEDKFDDEDEWGETSVKQRDHVLDSSSDSEANDTLIEEQKDKKQSTTDAGTSPKRGQSQADNDQTEASPPPTSKLMTKLFPKLKPQKPAQTQAQLEKLQASREVPVSDGIQSKLLRDKLAELEAEINKFRAENSNLDRLRKEREEGLSKLKKEITDFEKEKNEELQRLNEFKTQEMKKLKHEKKVFEKYQKAARAMPDKKEREEMETLRSQLSDLQEELKRKESRWSMNTTRLKSRMEEVEQENVELKAEIRILEKKRLEWLQKEQASKAAGRYQPHNATPSEQTPSMGTVTNGHLFTDSEEERDPIRADQKRLTRHPSASGMTLKPENHRQDKVSPRAHHKHERSNTANQRPKSGRPTTNQISDKSNSPSKSSNQKPRPGSAKLLNSTRMSLTEDLPRRQFNAEATPQPAPLSSSGSNTTQQTRKLAARFNVDKSSIDKGGDFEETQHPDGKVERIYNTGAREILFSNGTRKEISSDGQSIIVSFFNGDIKQIMADQRVVYYYSEAQTTHSTYPDGLEILQFPNNQVEKHYPDGTKEITFPDQTIKYLFPSGLEESVFTDGTVIRVDKTGDKTIEFPNGQREIHTQQFKKREYPDGTVKTVFPDGRQETRYSNGRIRVKDREGNVVVDKRS